MDKDFKNKFVKFHDKNYKLLLLIPAALLIFSVIYLGFFYSDNGDIFYKDISLTGGTSVTINLVNEKIEVNSLKDTISEKFENVIVREVSDLITGEQIAVIVEIKTDECNEEQSKFIKDVFEDYLGYELVDGENSTFECTGSTLSSEFYKQLILAVLYAFSFMGVVIFFLFNKKNKTRIFLISLALLSPILFLFLKLINIKTAMIISLLSLGISFFFYIKESIPSLAVILSAFADIFLTLVVINMLGIPISTAGIVAFLMLIGYSVDTDILLTNKVLKREGESLNQKILDSFKTGITMTLTSLFAVIISLFIIGSFSSILYQIFLIMAIGLGFDLLNTWITNVSIIKWYVLGKEKRRNKSFSETQTEEKNES